MVLVIASAMATPTHQIGFSSSNDLAQFQSTSSAPNRTVYGYLPYWSSEPSTVDLSGLTHIAYFDATITADGTLANTERWENAAPVLVTRSHAEGIQVHLCVSSFSDNVINSVLPNQTHRATLIAEIHSLVIRHNADGVNIDIEGMDPK